MIAIKPLSTHQVAELLGVDDWRIRRLYETGTLPDPPRVGRNRAIPSSALPLIVDALRGRGWLPTETEISNKGLAR